MKYIAIDKAYIKDRIAELIKESNAGKNIPEVDSQLAKSLKRLREYLLSQGIEIPVEESWENVIGIEGELIPDYRHPNGVIIKPI